MAAEVSFCVPCEHMPQQAHPTSQMSPLSLSGQDAMDFIPDVEGDDVQAAYARWVASSGHVDAAVGIFEAHPFVKAAQVVTISTPLHNFEIHGFSLNIRSERVMRGWGEASCPGSGGAACALL